MRGGATTEYLVELFDHPGRGSLGDLCPMAPDGTLNRWVELKVEPRDERERSQHSDRILDESLVRIANRSDHTCAEILHPTNKIDDREGRDVIEQGVDGEVSSERVLFSRAECVVATNRRPTLLTAARFVFAVLLGVSCFGGGQLVRRNLTPERRDLNRLLTELDVRESETTADNPAVSKESLDFPGVRRRANVEVLRAPGQQQITNAASDEIGVMIELA